MVDPIENNMRNIAKEIEKKTEENLKKFKKKEKKEATFASVTITMQFKFHFKDKKALYNLEDNT